MRVKGARNKFNTQFLPLLLSLPPAGWRSCLGSFSRTRPAGLGSSSLSAVTWYYRLEHILPPQSLRRLDKMIYKNPPQFKAGSGSVCPFLRLFLPPHSPFSARTGLPLKRTSAVIRWVSFQSRERQASPLTDNMTWVVFSSSMWHLHRWSFLPWGWPDLGGKELPPFSSSPL